MAVLSADVDIPHLGTPTKLKLKADSADTFYKGALLFADGATGQCKALPDIAISADSFLGICAKQVTTTAANELVEVYVDGTFALKFIGAAAADVGNVVFIDADGTLSDNETDVVAVADAAVVAADILIGKCVGISEDDSTRGWVQLHEGAGIANVLGWL